MTSGTRPARSPSQPGRHIALGGLALYHHLLVCPAQRQALLVFMAVPGSASHAKLRVLAAASNEDSAADRQ